MGTNKMTKGITIYQHPNRGGVKLTLGPGKYNLTGRGWSFDKSAKWGLNNQISCFDIASGYYVRMYFGSEYTGKYHLFSGTSTQFGGPNRYIDYSTLARWRADDKYSSIVVGSYKQSTTTVFNDALKKVRELKREELMSDPAQD